MKNVITKTTKKVKFVSTLIMTYVCMLLSQTYVYADPPTDAVTQPLDNLKTLLTAIVTAIGGILVVKAIMEIATAYQQQDSASMASGVKQLVAGVLMAMVSTVLLILGL